MSSVPHIQMNPTSGDHARLLPKVQDLADFVYNGPANIEAASQAVHYDISTSSINDFQDRSAYPPSAYLDETLALRELVEVDTAGQTYISLLYTYRSCFRAMVAPTTLNDEELHEFHRKSFTVLNCEMQKIVQFMKYQEQAILTLRTHFQSIIRNEGKKLVESHGVLDAFIKCINTLIILDALKNNKSSVTNDFTAYKRSFSRLTNELENHEELSQEIRDMQMFLGNPSQPRDLIMYNLKQSLQTLDGYDLGLIALIERVQYLIENELWLLPEERFSYLRIVPFLLYLLDTDVRQDQSTKKSDLNVFRHRGLDLSFFKKLYKVTPVVPLYGDMHTSIVYVLRQCPHWEEDYADEWVTGVNDKLLKKYLLIHHHETVRSEYNKLTADFAALTNETKSYQDNGKQITPQMLERIFEVILNSFRCLSNWSSLVLNQCAWKYANPCSRDTYLQLSGKKNVSVDTVNTNTNDITISTTGLASRGDPTEYEKAVKYNYSSKELYCLLDVLAMIKGMGATMLAHENLLLPLLNRCIHDDVQVFLQSEVARPLRKAYKNDRTDVKEVLLQIREIGGDWFHYEKQKDDYLLVKKELMQVNRDFPRRATSPSATQLYLIRRLMYTVFSAKAPGMKGGFFSDKNLKDEWIPIWSKFYHDSYFYKYLLDYTNTIKNVTDMTNLWIHEFYLEMTGCIQFPISMSLPWILTEYLIKTRSLKENMLFPFDIYNDAAERALHTLKQQYLYDEIEAELNLAFDQLVYELSHDVFFYYKTIASATLIDKVYKLGFEYNKSDYDHLQIKHVRYNSIITQTHISLLGRSLDLQSLLGSYCNRLLRDNIHVCIRKYESGDFTNIIELKLALDNVKLTYDLLKESLPLDNFGSMVREIDECVGIGQFKSRILLHSFLELIGDVLVNYNYNNVTKRFVKSPYPIPNATDVQRESAPKELKTHFYFGKEYKEIYDRQLALYRGYIGVEHFKALFDVLDIGQHEMFIHEFVEELLTQVIGNIYVYLDTLLQGMTPTKPPSLQYSTIATYFYFDAKVSSISQWQQLRSLAFQKIRQFGNGIVVLLMIENISKCKYSVNSNILSIFTGQKATPPRDPTLPPLLEPQTEFVPNPQVTEITSKLTNTLHAIQKESDSFGGSKLSHTSAYVTSQKYMTTKTNTFYMSEELDSYVNPNTSKAIHSLTKTLGLHENTLQNQVDAKYKKSYFAYALNKIANVCKECRMTQSLASYYITKASNEANHTQKVIDLEQGKEVTRIIAALVFIFNQHPVKGQPSDNAIFGDGFFYGICTLLHVLEEKHSFKFLDFSSHMLRTDTLSPCPRDIIAAKKKGTLTPSEEQMLPLVIYFLSTAQLNNDLMNSIFSLLDTYVPIITGDYDMVEPPKIVVNSTALGGYADVTSSPAPLIRQTSVTPVYTNSPSASTNTQYNNTVAPVAPMAPLDEVENEETAATTTTTTSAPQPPQPPQMQEEEEAVVPEPAGEDLNTSTMSTTSAVPPPPQVGFGSPAPPPPQDYTAAVTQTTYQEDDEEDEAAAQVNINFSATEETPMQQEYAAPEPPVQTYDDAAPAEDYYAMAGQPPPPPAPSAEQLAQIHGSGSAEPEQDYYSMMGQPPPPPPPM